MKRTLWIFAVLLVIAIGTIVALFLVRKSKALDQYVHSDSQAVVTISLDDLMLDNLDQLFKRHAVDRVAPTSRLLDIKNWWRAGVGIPAQIHFFTLPDNPLTFYTIQKITNPAKWDAFLKKHVTDTIQIIEVSEQQLSCARLSSGVSSLYDNQYLLLRLAPAKQDDDREMLAIWEEKDNWVYVRDFNFSTTENPKAHVVYRHTDGTFQLFANLSNDYISLSGDWQLASDIPTIAQAREPEINDLFISFSSNLPLPETSFITKFFSTFASIEADELVGNAYDYVDVYVSADLTRQQDTVIVYDYDEDFNSIEKKEMQEIKVPVIESAWKGSEQLAAALPEKLFYRLHRYASDSLVILSTKEDAEFSTTFRPSSSPFQLAVDFRNIPVSWTNDILRSLRQQALQIDIESSALSQRTLGITGRIRYKEK